MKKTKFLILGGGVSGVSFAHFLNSKDYILIEKQKNLGGLCSSFFKKEFVWDCSGHFLHFKDKQMKEYIIKLLGDKLIERKRKSKIFYSGKMIDFPFQDNIHQLPFKEFVNCLILYLSRKTKRSKSFKNMILSKYGAGICNKFLIPYNEKLYACNLDDLDEEAMGRFFPKTSFLGMIRNFMGFRTKNYNDSFMFCKNGMQDLINQLSKKISNNILLDEEIVAIDYEKKIATTNRRKIHYEKLISTISLKILLNFLGKPFLTFSNKLSYNRVLVLNLGFDKPSLNNYHWCYFPSKNISFYRVGYYNNIRGQRNLSLYVEIGLKKSGFIDILKIKERVIRELKEINIISDHKLIAYNSVIIQPAYVHLTKNIDKDIEILKNDLKRKNIYLLGRYSEWRYCSIEDNMLSAKKLSESMIIDR